MAKQCLAALKAFLFLSPAANIAVTAIRTHTAVSPAIGMSADATCSTSLTNVSGITLLDMAAASDLRALTDWGGSIRGMPCLTRRTVARRSLSG